MKKKVASLLACMVFASSLGAVACANKDNLSAAGNSATAPASAQAADNPYATGTPWLACDIDGNVTTDTPTDAKDNFALFANKDALLGLEVTDEKPVAGTMADVAQQEVDDVKRMFLEGKPESHDAKLAYDLFWLLKDWDGRNALGVRPLKDRIDAIEAIGSIDELNTYFTDTLPEERPKTPWDSGSATDPADSSRNIIALDTMGLLLKDSTEYDQPSDFGAMMKDAYATLTQKVLVKVGYSEEEAAQKFENCLAFEKLLAPAICTSDEKRDPDYLARSERHYTRAEVEELQQQLPILEELEQAQGYPESDSYLVPEPDFFAKLNEVYTDENLELMKDYLIVKDTISAADALDRDCHEWFMQAMGALDGTTDIPDDDTYAANTVNRVSDAVARLYCETYLRQEDKERISSLVDEIIDAYHGILADADFISDETRAKAIEKLDAIDKRVLYPDDWSAYSYKGLDFASKDDGGTYWDASAAVDKFLRERDVESFSKPVDKSRWSAHPHEVNCFYDAQTNSIYIMGAFARGNVYNSDMSDEELYGKLGMVIGHEISHAFDEKGSQFDKDGNMANWWTDEDAAAFAKKNEKLAAYFSAIHPWEGLDLNGEIMTGETCADMAGYKCMLRLAAKKSGFDYDKFFRANANLWLCKESGLIAEQAAEDVHPLNYLRVNATLQQFDEFLEQYDIHEGDAMYLAPEDRVAIW